MVTTSLDVARGSEVGGNGSVATLDVIANVAVRVAFWPNPLCALVANGCTTLTTAASTVLESIATARTTFVAVSIGNSVGRSVGNRVAVVLSVTALRMRLACPLDKSFASRSSKNCSENRAAITATIAKTRARRGVKKANDRRATTCVERATRVAALSTWTSSQPLYVLPISSLLVSAWTVNSMGNGLY